jgi:hypothetical protein
VPPIIVIFREFVSNISVMTAISVVPYDHSNSLVKKKRFGTKQTRTAAACTHFQAWERAGVHVCENSNPAGYIMSAAWTRVEIG